MHGRGNKISITLFNCSFKRRILFKSTICNSYFQASGTATPGATVLCVCTEPSLSRLAPNLPGVQSPPRSPCLSLFPRWALEDWRTFLGLPEASQLIQRDGPLPSSLWDSGKPITLGNSELLPLHLLLRHCLAAFPPQGGSLLFPAAPQSPSHLPRGPPPALPLRIRLLLILSWPCRPCLVRTAGPSITLAVHREPF